MWKDGLEKIQAGDSRMLARFISLVENRVAGYDTLMRLLPHQPQINITGLTGPPGAGKSTLADALIGEWVQQGKKVAVLCVDPSSPFNQGAILGDRIRMREWYNHPSVFIRSLASRGSLGGLHPHIIEITALLKAAPFDQVLIETVGVGQSEIEIAGLADTTVLVLVPEAGDDIQTMKAGVMEVADIFVVNKSDRPAADVLAKNLQLVAHGQPVLKTVANRQEGITALSHAILQHQQQSTISDKKYYLLARRLYHLIQQKRMENVDRDQLLETVKAAYGKEGFNLYQLLEAYS